MSGLSYPGIKLPPELAGKNHISAKEFNELNKKKKQNKYHAKKTEIDGHIFDSKKEANRYCELKLLKQAGEILDFELQPEFILQDTYINERGKKVRAIKYRADFRVIYPDFTVIIEDVKPSPKFQTKEYRLKKKLFGQKYPQFELREIY